MWGIAIALLINDHLPKEFQASNKYERMNAIAQAVYDGLPRENDCLRCLECGNRAEWVHCEESDAFPYCAVCSRSAPKGECMGKITGKRKRTPTGGPATAAPASSASSEKTVS